MSWRLFVAFLVVSFAPWASAQMGPSQFHQEDFIRSWALYDAKGMHYAFCYKTGIRFGSDSGQAVELTGHWQDKVFLSSDPATKSDVETAKILDNGDLELHAALFTSGDATVYVLHPPDHQPPGAIALTSAHRVTTGGTRPHDLHLKYPPPAGTIKVGMKFEDVQKLPWRYDGQRRDLYDHHGNTTMYYYNSDDPTLLNLTVTVRDGTVIAVNGGNG
jgi:hypothetical protein